MHDLADRHDRDVGAAGGDHAGRLRAARRGLGVDLVRDAEARKEIFQEPDAAGAFGDRDDLGIQHDLLEGLDGAHVGLRGPRFYRHAQRHDRKINVRPGGDPLVGDQLGEAFPGEDHHVGGHAAGKLRGNRFRSASLRRTRSGRDLDAGRALEFRQQLLVRAAEAAGHHHVQLRRCRRGPKQRRGKDDE